MCLARTIQSGDLKPAAEYRLDGRDVDHFLFRNRDADGLTVDLAGFILRIDEHNRHGLLQILLGRARHDLGPRTVQADIHGRLAALLVKSRGGTRNLIARDDHALLQ